MQKSKLLADDRVVAYLGSMEITGNDLGDTGSANEEEEDFS